MKYVRRLDRALVLEAAAQTHATWGDDLSIEDHTARVFEQLRRAGPELLRYVGLVDGGRLVASIKRYGLALTGPTGLVRAVGIGAVFTAPEARGRGLASALLREVMGEARALGYGAAFLYSDIPPSFYEALGFVSLPARDFRVPVGSLPEARALELRRASDRDLEAVLALYEAGISASHAAWLRPSRSPATLRFFAWRNGVQTFLLREGGRSRGILLAHRDDPRRDLPGPREADLLWFDEAWAPGVDPDRVWATVRSLALRLKTTQVGGWMGPSGAPAAARLLGRAASFPMIAALTPALTIRPRRTLLDSFQHF